MYTVDKSPYGLLLFGVATMRYFYIKKGNLYLHIRQTIVEDYQDYSDVNAMLAQEYFTSELKDGAIKFLEKKEITRFLATKGRKLKGFEPVQE